MSECFPLDKKIYPSKIVQDYLNNPGMLSSFLNMGFSQHDFAEQMGNKQFSNKERELLYERTLFKYKRADVDVPDSLSALLDANCYTVTTGHQLCLFGGPQYFIHKISFCWNFYNIWNICMGRRSIFYYSPWNIFLSSSILTK